MSNHLVKFTYEPLSEKERSKLKKGFIFIPVFILISGGIFYFMLSGPGSGDDFFGFAVMGMAVIFIAVIFWITRAVVLDLRDNEKKIIQGVITLKETHTSTGKKRRTTYYFHFGDYKLSVQANIYHQFEEGDLIEIHQAKRVYNITFDSKLLKRGVLPEEVEKFRAIHEEKTKKVNRLSVVIFVIVVLGIIGFVLALSLGLII